VHGLNTAVIILGIVVGCCIFLSFGAYLAKRNTLDLLLKIVGYIALATVIIYVAYVAWFTLMGVK
jgi:hypothetical protein